MLGEVARRHDRKVVVVDPWQLGTQNCEGGENETFLGNTERFGDRIEVIRASSLTDGTKAAIARRALSFAVVDGRQDRSISRHDWEYGTAPMIFGIVVGK